MLQIPMIRCIFLQKNNFAEGERWMQRYMVEHPDEFKGRLVTFESRMKTGETTRRTDVVSKIVKNGVRSVYGKQE